MAICRSSNVLYPWLMLGDCLECMAEIPDSSVDLILADLPYGVTDCKWDSVIPFEPLWEHYWRVLKPNGPCVLFGAEPFSTKLRMSQLKHFKYDWMWEKDKPNNFQAARFMPLKYHEVISVFYRSLPNYFPQKIARTASGKARCKSSVNFKAGGQGGEHLKIANSKNYKKEFDPDLKNPSTVLKFSTGRRQDYFHPTQKPVGLLEYIIKTYTSEGEVVLDNTMGSGSTGVACVNTKRNFIGIEYDSKYFDIASKRISDTEGKS